VGVAMPVPSDNDNADIIARLRALSRRPDPSPAKMVQARLDTGASARPSASTSAAAPASRWQFSPADLHGGNPDTPGPIPGRASPPCGGSRPPGPQPAAHSLPQESARGGPPANAP